MLKILERNPVSQTRDNLNLSLYRGVALWAAQLKSSNMKKESCPVFQLLSGKYRISLCEAK